MKIKYLLQLLILVLLISCSDKGFTIPQEETEIQLSAYMHKESTTQASYISSEAEAGKNVLLYGCRGVSSDLEILKYMVPLLGDLHKLSLGLWFLKGVDQTLLNRYLAGEKDGFTAEDLLFLSDPSRTGYKEYADFLRYLRNYISISPSDLEWNISGQKDDTIFLYYDVLEALPLPNSEEKRSLVLIHNPLFDAKGHRLLPFQGQLFSLLIQRWQKYEFSAVSLKDSAFGDLFLTHEDIESGSAVKDSFDCLFLTGQSLPFMPLTKIESFITEENARQALESFPDQIIRKKPKPAAYVMNVKLRRWDKKNIKYLKKLSEILCENNATCP